MGNYRKYTINDHYFEYPTLKSSFVAGMIASDGSIVKNSNRIDVTQTEKDRKFVQYVADELKYTLPLRERSAHIYIRKTDGKYGPVGTIVNNKPSVSMQVSSAKIKQDLEKWYNIGANKSFTLSPPNIKDPDMLLSYISGLFCGDGCLTVMKRSSGFYLRLNFSLPDTITYWLKIELNKHFKDLHFSLIRRINGLLVLEHASQKGSLAILNLLNQYNPGKLLQRKFIPEQYFIETFIPNQLVKGNIFTLDQCMSMAKLA